MYQPILYALPDVAVTAVGRLREATDAEAVGQSLGWLLFDIGAIATPLTIDRQASIRTSILDMLSQHPRVSSVDAITFTPQTPGTNLLGISVHINGEPTAITPTSH